ncbi:hypothetical protein VPH35_125774 [Triticum aestivum]
MRTTRAVAPPSPPSLRAASYPKRIPASSPPSAPGRRRPDSSTSWSASSHLLFVTPTTYSGHTSPNPAAGHCPTTSTASCCCRPCSRAPLHLLQSRPLPLPPTTSLRRRPAGEPDPHATRATVSHLRPPRYQLPQPAPPNPWPLAPPPQLRGGRRLRWLSVHGFGRPPTTGPRAVSSSGEISDEISCIPFPPVSWPEDSRGSRCSLISWVASCGVCVLQLRASGHAALNDSAACTH